MKAQLRVRLTRHSGRLQKLFSTSAIYLPRRKTITTNNMTSHNEAQKTNEGTKREYYKWHYDNRETVTPADIADWWLQKITTRDQQHKKEMEDVYRWLLSMEARLATNPIESDYEQGYFDAVDDIAKHFCPTKDLCKGCEEAKEIPQGMPYCPMHPHTCPHPDVPTNQQTP